MYFLVSPSRYHVLPVVGAAAWFLTLSVLLIYWLAEGRPVYPSQVNPYVAFISDIGAYRLKPFFIFGSIVTAIAYAGTIFAAHHVRSDSCMYGIRDPPWKRVFSLLALIAGVAASVGCVGLATFDTRRASEVHGPMLFMTLLGIAVSASCTEIVYSDQMRRSSRYGKLRKYCLISLGIVVSEVVLSAVFLECSWTNHERVGGILEWVVAFIGTFFILAFVGFVRVVPKAPSGQSLHHTDKHGMEIIGGVSGVLAIVASVSKLSKKLNEIRDSYSSVALNIQLAAIQLATIRDALEDIAAWRLKVQSETKAAKKLDAALADSLKGCAVLITVIDSKLGEAGYVPGFKGKIRHMWLEDVLKGYISNLDGQVRALQLLLTSNQMSTLADVMHHLEKSEARAVFEQVRADTASLTVGNKDLEDVVSVVSGYTPSVNFAVDDILMAHPAYQAAYGNRRPPLPARPSQDQAAKNHSTNPTKAEAKVLDKPRDIAPDYTIDPTLDPANRALSKPQIQQPLVSQERRPQTEESTNTISPSDTYSHFSHSLAPTPLAISKHSQGRSNQDEGDASLASAVECFKDQIKSAFDDKPHVKKQDHDIQVHTPQSDGDSFDLDEMISLLPVASHFDISRKPRDQNRPPHRQSISSRENDKRTIKAEDSSSVSSNKSERPSPSVPPEVGPPLLEDNGGGERSAATRDADSRADEETPDSSEELSATRSGSSRRDGDGSLPRTSSIRSLKRPPSTDSDLYTSSLSDKKDDKPQVLKRSPSTASKQSAKSSGKRKSPHSSIHEEGPDQAKTSDPANDETPSSSRAEGIDVDLPLVESPAVGDTVLSSAETIATDLTATRTNIRPQVALQAAPAASPPSQGSSTHMGFVQQPDAPHVRPRSSTAQVSRTSPPFRKPVPSNSLRRSELSSPDFVKYSNPEHHGLKIFLTPESEPKQRHMSTPALAPPPPPPTRPPPSVPPNAYNPLATLSPTTSLDITRRWSNESSPSRYMTTSGLASPIERDESINETLSTLSSSDRSDAQTLSSAMTSTTNTVATSQPSDSIRSQAQDDLQKLQQQLSAAKVRGDSTAQKASLQQSMEIIKKAYLSQSTAKAIDMNQNGTSTAKPKAIRKKSSSLLTMVGRKSKHAEIHKAARTGDNDTLRSLLEDRANANVKGEMGKTPLMEAATRSYLHCMQTLKEFGADEFAIDGSGRNVLHMAVSAEQPKAVSWLIEAYPPTAPDVPGKKSSRLAWATEAITGSRSSKILQEASDGNGSRPLHIATKHGSVDMVSLLLDLGSDIEAKDNWARTPLIDAAMDNRLEVVNLLLNRGADVSPEDWEGMTAVHWAAKKNHLGVLRTLLSNGDARFKNRSWFQDCYNKNGDLPIHSASRNGYIEPMKLLKGDRPMPELRTKHGETLLHIAALANQLPLAKELFRDTIDVNTWAKPHSYHLRLWPHDETEYNPKALPLPYNIIPLHYACTRGYFEMTELLIENGAWVNAAPDDDDHGMSPLMMAVECGSTNLVCLLLARGAKVTATVPATLFTALHFACRRGDVETSQELVRYGAKTAATTKDMRTPEEMIHKVKDSKKKAAMENYFRELTRQRYAKIKAQMAENRQNATPSLTPQPTPSPQPPQQITYVYPSGTVVYPPGTVLPGTSITTQFMDQANDAYPEAPPAYTPGSNAPRYMTNRPGVNRPHYG